MVGRSDLRLLGLLITSLTLASQVALAQSPMTYIYNAPESELDQRYVYQWEILRAALEITLPSHGDYVMTPSPPMSELRQADELMAGTGRLTVVYLDVKPGLPEKLNVVPIPVDRNLSGYRVFLIREDLQAELERVESVEDLKKFTFGFGLGWIDSDVMKSNGFQVMTGSAYEGLFKMVALRRFDIFSRSVAEVGGEMKLRSELFPPLTLEKTLCLSLPMPMFFWFSKTPEGSRLAARAEAGMRTLIANGTYDRIFRSHFQQRLAELNLPARKVLVLTNPFIPPDSIFADRRFWYQLK